VEEAVAEVAGAAALAEAAEAVSAVAEEAAEAAVPAVLAAAVPVSEAAVHTHQIAEQAVPAAVSGGTEQQARLLLTTVETEPHADMADTIIRTDLYTIALAITIQTDSRTTADVFILHLYL